MAWLLQADPERNPAAANQFANTGAKSRYLDPEGLQLSKCTLCLWTCLSTG
jgi:hypothetical protein